MTPEEIISMITERVKDTANVKVVFGDPIQSGGVTVIPVASVKVAGGGGGGRGKGGGLPVDGEELPEGGVGLGMRITAKPLGYIEVVDGTAKLVPIVDVGKVAITALVAVSLTIMTFAKLAWRRSKLQAASESKP